MPDAPLDLDAVRWALDHPSLPLSWDELRRVALGLANEVERLRAEVDEAQLRSIEARNPGIDMDEVRRIREDTDA